ncbi:MAG: DUF2304 family protein [Candidatus Pacebacteria bacterium]|nr:DUF2304 family protein [Candidatus Paceibacterota bacterium]
MTLIQIIGAGFVILIIIKTASDFKKKKLNLPAFLFWTFIWTVILVVAFLPQVTNFFANLLGVGRGIDVAIYFSILIIFFILFQIISRLETMKREITEIVRHISLKEK